MQFLNRFFQIVLTPLRLLLDLFAKAVPGLKAASRISTPALAGIMMFVFLAIVQVAFLVVVSYSRDSVQFDYYVSRLWITIPLILVTPFFVYLFVKLLLAGEKSRFPDLDNSFEAGLAAVREAGIDIQNTPIFLVLGVRDAMLPTRLMGSSGRSFEVNNVYGDAPSLQWYANQDEIYIYCRRAGGLSLLSQRLEKRAPSGGQTGDFLGTILPNEISPTGESGAAQPAFNVTAVPGQIEPDDGDRPIGTGTLDARVAEQISQREPTPLPQKKPEGPGVALSTQQVDEYEARLAHVCQLINKTRLPTCPINGVITTMGIAMIEEQPDAAATRVKADLGILLEELKLVCPVTNIVTDLDGDEGGVELANRLGSRYKERRFGKGNRVWNDPTVEQMRVLSVHTTGAFELWVHKLFQEPDSLKTNEVFGNRRLYRLLCRVMVALSPGMETVLTNGFGVKSQDGYLDDHMKFGGCYFTGIGSTEEQQFFVRGVFDRIADGAGELEWTGDVFYSEERLKLFTNLSLVAGVAALATLIVMVTRS